MNQRWLKASQWRFRDPVSGILTLIHSSRLTPWQQPADVNIRWAWLKWNGCLKTIACKSQFWFNRTHGALAVRISLGDEAQTDCGSLSWGRFLWPLQNMVLFQRIGCAASGLSIAGKRSIGLLLNFYPYFPWWTRGPCHEARSISIGELKMTSGWD